MTLSIVMPFYKKYKEFQFAMTACNLNTFNHYLNLELVIVCDDPSETKQLKIYLEQLCTQFTIKFAIKVFVNYTKHEWRAPIKAINVGIKHSSFERILVISPETLVLKNSLQLIQTPKKNNTFLIGLIKSASTEALVLGDNLVEKFHNLSQPFYKYGSICFSRKQAEAIGGYDETIEKWGGDDDDFRYRLSLAGYKKITTLAKFLHVYFPNRQVINMAKDKIEQTQQSVILEKLLKIKANPDFVANQGRFGESFNNLLFQYTPPRIAVSKEALCF